MESIWTESMGHLEEIAGLPRIRPIKEPKPEPGNSDQAAVAAYVAALSCDLAVLARRHNLDTLGYLLDMVRVEAEGASHGAKQA
jgi:hypothetical protein